MSRRTVYTLLLIICIVGFWLFENFYTPDTYSVKDKSKKEEKIDNILYPSSTYGNIVSHEYYTFSYSEPHEQAEWVAYSLKREHLTNDDRRRPYFIEDPEVKSKSADWRNYRGSGYDRGHLVPAGDRRFSEQAYNETFYTSNISPQDRDFNAGIWNRLEQQVRYWCKKYGDLVVITGGILERGLEEIGEEDVDVPRYFYKIIYRETADGVEIISFVMPNQESDLPLQDFVVTLDEIERQTNIDFFYEQPKDWQNQLESRVELSNWKF
ncbi:DNA/RNA non-specific endonuclease [Flagellimonas meridianipacifica]|uniref:Endonuclease n=1 Tax=Flagellimonas meridianipacifica TaxID=1080225 RepID=A0A2T0MFN2_9FLAO|nr:DNA/RNA non-specific endonuclease [Allomuricauda pacifica]PRX56346.1 endonuclease G [Allomuricauda pacifica]